MLEMCDTEEISFIDDDPCDIIVDDNPDNVTKDESGDNQVDNLKNMQQIVIKINNFSLQGISEHILARKTSQMLQQ